MAANEACRDDCEYVNESNKKPFRTILTEDDIPGASLNGRKAEQLKNEPLVEMQRSECVWNSNATTSKVNIKCVHCFSIPTSLALNFLLIFYF